MQVHADIVDTIFNAPINDKPLGWKLINTFAVGGLYAAGFELDSENLLVVSSNGQSLIDTTTGERLYRNRENNGYNHKKLEAVRLNKPEQVVRMSGMDGGGLRTGTDDGWRLHIVYKNWPRGRLVLQKPGTGLFGTYIKGVRKDPCVGSHVIAARHEFRIWGFSNTGNVMIWSDEVDVRVYRKLI